MTYSSEKRRLDSEQELIEYLGKLPFVSGEQVGIVAGHFMLMYDDQADRLVPMVYQDATNPKVELLSKEMAGDFPLRTFKLGLSLVKSYQGKSIFPKLVLIVNDHIFQTEGWSTQGLKDKDKAGSLRQSFYRQKYPLPKSFFREIKEAGLSTEIILENNNAGRISDILPKTTRLFSEQALRNYFDQYRRNELRRLPLFTEVTRAGTKSKLLFKATREGPDVCLAEDGECGCSGELIEFFIRLAAKSFKQIIFFVPDECKIAVDVGIRAFLHTPSEYTSDLKSVYVVHGLGGMGINDTKNGPFEVTIHSLSQ